MYNIEYSDEDALNSISVMKFFLDHETEVCNKQLAFIKTIQSEFFNTSYNLNKIRSIQLNFIKDKINNKVVRSALIKFLVILSLCDTKISIKRINLLKKIDNLLETNEHSIKFLSFAYNKQYRRLRHDIRIRAFGKTSTKPEPSFSRKLASLKAELRVLLKRPTHNHINSELLSKVKSLSKLPEDTVGYNYIKYLNKNKFPYPGDIESAAEFIICHDLTHVLSGYDTTPEDEVKVLFLTAGYQSQDPMSKILFALFQFHCGVPIGLIADSFKDSFIPEQALRAYRIGQKMNIDLEDEALDYWSIMYKPLNLTREEFNIPHNETI